MPELGQVLVATQECHARDAERTLHSPVACGIGQAGGFKIECQVAFGHGWRLIVHQISTSDSVAEYPPPHIEGDASINVPT